MMTLSADETSTDKTQPCLHEHTKCLHCGMTFREQKPVTVSEKRRNLSSGTYFGTFMKSIDETAAMSQSIDEESIHSEDGDSVNEFSSPSKRCSYLVKYSVNGVLKGQTRLSYDQDDSSSELTRQKSTSSSSSADVFGNDDDEIDEMKDENKGKYEENDDVYHDGSESSEAPSLSEDTYDENGNVEVQKSDSETEQKKHFIETEDLEKPLPQIEKKRNFSVKKQHSLDEYRLPGRRTSSKMQEKLSLFS